MSVNKGIWVGFGAEMVGCRMKSHILELGAALADNTARIVDSALEKAERRTAA